MYVKGQRNCRLYTNSKHFKSEKSIGDDSYQVYEIQMAYKSLRMDTPIHIGINILLLSKLRVLEFAYSFIDYFIPRALYDPVLMDTDSFYMQIGGREIEDVVRPELLDEYRARLENFHGDERHPDAYLPRTCCDEHARDDDKQYYLFKCEMRARVVVALTSKTYCCHALDGGYKLTAKGANKRAIEAKAQGGYVELYKTVLDTGDSASITNRGFISQKGEMKTYEVDRNVFPFVYFKRKLVENKYHTLPYEDLILEACGKTYICIPTELRELSMDHFSEFTWREWACTSIRQAVCLLKKLYCQVAGDRNGKIQREIPTTRVILTTTQPRKLCIMMQNMGPCALFNREIYTNLVDIVKSAMEVESEFKRSLLLATGDHPLVNCCPMDYICGNGQSPQVTRWRPKAVKEGNNYLGRIYVQLREELTLE